MRSVVYVVVREDDGTQSVFVKDNPENINTDQMVGLGMGLDGNRAANLVRDDVNEMVASWEKEDQQ